jgi:hypothetical protein
MTETNTGSQTFAALALVLLENGELDELHTLLVNEVNPARAGGWARADGLRLAAAQCSVGFSWPGIAWVLGTDTGAFDPTRSLRGSVELYAGAARAPLPSGALRTLQSWMLANTEQLLSARDCMAAVTMAGAHAAIARGTSSIETEMHLAYDHPDEFPRAQEPEWILGLLAAQSAERTTNERAAKRVLYWARLAGLTQREVAESMHKSQTHVFRQLQEIDADPRMLAMTPRELHDHYRAGHVDRTQFLALLAAYPYESGMFPRDAPDWGYVPGSYDELTQLAGEGSISHEELDVVLAGIEALEASDE